MSNKILIAIITSTALATMLGSVFQLLADLVKSRIDFGKTNDVRDYEDRKERQRKKEESYLMAIKYCIKAKNIMQFHKRFAMENPKKLSSEIENINKIGDQMSYTLRLYAPEEISKCFQELIGEANFIVNNKLPIQVDVIKKYEHKFDELVKMMKKELKYD